MKIVLLITFILTGTVPAVSQIPDKASQIEQVQTTAATLIGKRQQATLILSDLTELKGSVVALTGDSFSFKFKGINGKKLIGTILYSEVLEIKSKSISISFIPPETMPQFGSWEEVLKFPYNTRLEVVLENGQTLSGRSGEIKKDELALFNNSDNEKLVLSRDQIFFIYKVRIPYGKTRDGLAGGTKKGGEIGRDIGNTPSGKAFSSALGALIGAGAGAITGAAKKGKKLRVLIYSK